MISLMLPLGKGLRVFLIFMSMHKVKGKGKYARYSGICCVNHAYVYTCARLLFCFVIIFPYYYPFFGKTLSISTDSQ